MTQSERRFSCSIGIDMGAKYTGVFYALFDREELPTNLNSKAMTLVMPETGPRYVQAQRTAVRHRLRGQKRYTLARKLAFLVVDDMMKKQEKRLTDEEWKRGREALSGLLKRRGYSRPNADGEDLTPLENVRAEVFAAHPAFSTYFSEVRSLAEQWEEFTANISNVEMFLGDSNIPADKEFVDFAVAEGLIDKTEKKAYLSALSTMRANANVLTGLRQMGHKPRSEYFKAIEANLKKDSRLAKICEAFGGADRLARLLGNLSNLQLRAERWYFNAPDIMKDRGWEPDRFKKTLVRAFKFFHPAKDQNKQHLELIKQIENSEDIIETLCTLDPNRTIPPYEDQNNRRPPLDQTLLLSPEKLTRQYGEIWKTWSARLTSDEPTLAPAAEILERSTDRKSRVAVNGHEPLPTLAYQLSYALQRAFDRSKALDPYALRALAAGSKSNKLTSARTALENCIGGQNVEKFLDCARRYYREADDAKVGLWFDNADGLLERSDLHPPMKKKILPLLVANILQTDETTGQKFLDEIWRKQIKGRETVASRCARIETVRKSFGGGFNIAYNTAQYRKVNKLPRNAQDKELLTIRDRVAETADFIAANLGLSDEQKRKFANPFSLAQFYTLIETEVSGFSATTLAVHLENAWRMTIKDAVINGETVRAAQCSRLPAETARPFDGLVRRLVDRQAWEIAKRVSTDIQSKVDFSNGIVDVSIFVEENKFEFSASVADLKKNKRVKDKMLSEAEKLETRWLNKNERIKTASRETCPYTGQRLAEGGEIDHILPRSLIKDARGIVFNSEPNLIYVSSRGNQLKKDQRYSLSNLHTDYLKKIFKTSNIAAITAEIEDVVTKLQQTHRLKFFDLLNEHEQDCVRHTLFLDDGSEARNAVLELLATQRRTRVNGTQIWMIKNLANKIREEPQDWCRTTNNRLHFQAAATDVSTAKNLRLKLAQHQLDFEKPDIQPIASHSIDALCSFAVGSADAERDQDGFDYLDGKAVLGLYPQSCEVIHLQAKPQEDKSHFDSVAIFKEGIYAEQFLPIFTLNGKIWIGYETLDAKGERCGAIEVSGKQPEELLSMLAPFFNKPVGDLSAHATYRIQKKPAYEFLAKAALQPLSAEEKRLAALLDALRYCTSRKSLMSLCMATNGKSLKKREDVLKPKLFQLKVELKGEKAFKLNGSLTLPVKQDWLRICDSPELVDAFGKPCSADELTSKLARIWKRPVMRDLAHAPVRREFSLPAIDNPSGGFRIRRTNLFGNELYQVHAINAKKYCGFASAGSNVDWSKGILFNELQHENLTECGGRFITSADVTPMSEWRKVVAEDNLSIWIAPGTEGRRYVRVETTFIQASHWFEQSVENWAITSPLSLPASFKVDKPAEFQKAVGTELSELLGQPRDKIFIESIVNTKRIRFWYTVKNSNKKMNESYNNASKS